MHTAIRPSHETIEGIVSAEVVALVEEIKQKGRQSAVELPALLTRAECFATDTLQTDASRGVAHRAAGNALQLLNQFEPALSHYDKAIDILNNLSGQGTELGRTLIAKVGLLHQLSRFDELFRCAARARLLLREIDDARGLGRLDINLAHAYFRLDRHRESLEYSERALATLERIGDREGILGATINSAVILSWIHDFERSEAYFRRAEALSNELKLTAWALVSRLNLAYLRYLSGDPGEALREFATLRDQFAAAQDERRICLCWLDEAEILLEIGDLEESVRSARAAGILAEKLGLNLEMGKSLLFEGIAVLRSGSEREAFEILQQASSRFEVEGNGILPALSRLQIALFEGEHGNGTVKALPDAMWARSILQLTGLPNRIALAEIVVGRIQRATGDLHSATNSFQAALKVADESRSKWMQFHACLELARCLKTRSDPATNPLFLRAEGLLDSLWDRLGSDDLKMAFLVDRETVYTHLIDSTVEASQEAIFELSEKSRSRVLCERLLGGAKPSTAEIQSRLSEDETILEYFIAGDDVHIFAVNCDKLISVRRTGVIKRIETEIANLERHLASCSVKWERLQGAAEHLRKTAQVHLEVLYEELIAPVQEMLRAHLVIVPHGILHTIPFQALHGNGKFLADSYRVSYSPSARLYCTGSSDTPDGQPLFIAFSAGRDTSSFEEVGRAAQYFHDAQVLVNPSSTELQNGLATPRSLLHIAGHAGIDTVAGKISWIETPDGRLTSRNFMDMRIQARTLVITGCRTARREIRPGEEWLGLMRAFYLSGATTIVSALWDIRDDAARRFSAAFYQNLREHDAGAAAHMACAALRTWRDHPYFWAGFGVFERKRTLEAV